MIQDIDFSKYKRFFAFGCSFTGYCWPTWADILSKEMPNAEFYNCGKSGAGNLFISIRALEANLKFNFNKDDLVIVMWSTFCREDRYYNNYWHTPGNIFTQQEYDEKWVKKFADPKGYLIRDLSLITMATSYLKSLPCTTITLASTPYWYQQHEDFDYSKKDDGEIKDILDSFKETINQTPQCLFDLEMKGIWDNGHVYIWNKNKVDDYHPNPWRYRCYLEKLGFNLTEKSENYAKEATIMLHRTKTRDEILSLFNTNEHGNGHFSKWW